MEIAEGVSLKRALKSSVSGTGRNTLEAALEAPGKTDAEVQAEADTVFREITPIVDFIADYANLWALKPLLLVDLSQMNAPRSRDTLRLGVGAGLQATGRHCPTGARVLAQRAPRARRRLGERAVPHDVSEPFLKEDIDMSLRQCRGSQAGR
jgi:hypothetical protein